MSGWQIIHKMLGLLKPANKQLQGSSSMNMQRAMQLIDAVHCKIENLHTNEMFSKLYMAGDQNTMVMITQFSDTTCSLADGFMSRTAWKAETIFKCTANIQAYLWCTIAVHLPSSTAKRCASRPSENNAATADQHVAWTKGHLVLLSFNPDLM